MTTEPNRHVLRMRMKHAAGSHEQAGELDGARLVAAQSVPSAIVAGLVAVVVFAVLWAMVSVALARVFPWLTLLLGVLTGFAVRRGGQGFDWRFPVVAGLLAFAGSILGNIVVAAAYTAAELGTGTFMILRNVTAMTWPVFFGEALTAADYVYAFFSAGIAAYFSVRRLTRREYHAVRKLREDSRNG